MKPTKNLICIVYSPIIEAMTQVNYAESRSQDHDSDCDKVGLVVQHVLSAGVEMSPRGTGSWTQELLVMYAMIVIHLLNCII